jgi:hypothetical protein
METNKTNIEILVDELFEASDIAIHGIMRRIAEVVTLNTEEAS